jgi:hypothetical protein
VPRIRPSACGRPLIAVAALCLALAAPSWGATTFTVNSVADLPDQNAADQLCKAADGSCTIRVAITQANSLLGTDEIDIPPGTYTVNTGSLQPDTPMNIVGMGGAKATTLDMKNTSSGVVIDNTGPVTLTGLSITNVVGVSPPVYVQGPDVTLTGVHIRGNSNTGGLGGGIRLFSGSLSVVRSAITGNTASSSLTGLGGGVYIDGRNSVFDATTIAGNTAKTTGGPGGTAGFGGGIWTNGTSLVLRHVTVTDNIATAGSANQAGGNLDLNGDTVITDSIVTGGQSGPVRTAAATGVAPSR